jgi:hypothetical protein
MSKWEHPLGESWGQFSCEAARVRFVNGLLLLCGATLNTMGTSVNHPYFSPDELAFLCERQRGGKMSETQESKARIQGCLFIEAVSSKIGL